MSNERPKKENDKPKTQNTQTQTQIEKKPQILGYGESVPDNLFGIEEVELRYKESARKVGIIVSKSLIVINIYSHTFSNKIYLGDFITHFNDETVTSKNRIYELLDAVLKNHEVFYLKVKRPKWLTLTNTVPKGYDIAPGYSYFQGLLVLFPNSGVGLNVKAFSSRIYVVRVEGDSIAVNTCLVGDCIVDVDGCPITTVSDCSEKIIKGLKEKRYVSLTIERATTPETCRAVRCALFAEKTMPLDPKMATDSSKIGEDEATKVKQGRVPDASKGILKQPGKGVTGVSFYGTEKPHMDIKPESVEHCIGCEPYNPLFFHKVKRGAKDEKEQGSSSGTSTGNSEKVEKQEKSRLTSKENKKLDQTSGKGSKIEQPKSTFEKKEPDSFGSSMKKNKNDGGGKSKMLPPPPPPTSSSETNQQQEKQKSIYQKVENQTTPSSSATTTPTPSELTSSDKNKKSIYKPVPNDKPTTTTSSTPKITTRKMESKREIRRDESKKERKPRQQESRREKAATAATTKKKESEREKNNVRKMESKREVAVKKDESKKVVRRKASVDMRRKSSVKK